MEPAVLGDRFRTIAGRELLFDDEGFLVHPEDWTEEVAVELAAEPAGAGAGAAAVEGGAAADDGAAGGAELGDEQWRVIRFLREFYFENGRSPLNRRIVEGVGMSLLDLECLFPGGIRHGAKRVAGLPNPKRCA